MCKMYLINYKNQLKKKPTQKIEWENCYEKECDLSNTCSNVIYKYL